MELHASTPKAVTNANVLLTLRVLVNGETCLTEFNRSEICV